MVGDSGRVGKALDCVVMAEFDAASGVSPAAMTLARLGDSRGDRAAGFVAYLQCLVALCIAFEDFVEPFVDLDMPDR